MAKRIPHTDLEVITGEQSVEEYLAMQKKLGRFYLGRFLRILASQKKKGRFLEIGSGPGYQTAEIAERNRDSEIVAVEPSADMITVAKSYMEQRGLTDRVRFVEGSVEDEMLINSLGTFDLIYSTFSLHHWQDPVQAIQNLCQVLNEGGVLLIYDFERHWLTYYLPTTKGIAESVRASYTLKELSSMMAGLNIQKYYRVERHFPYLYILIVN